MSCFVFQMSQINSLSDTIIVLSKYNSSERGISVVLQNVQSVKSSWILHDLDLIMINCSIGKSKLYMNEQSIKKIGAVVIKNSTFWKLKVMGAYDINVRSSKIVYVEARNSDLLLTGIIFSAESVVKTNNCSVRMNGIIKQETVAINSGKILLGNQSHLLVTNATFENSVGRIWIKAEESNVTLKNSVISSIQMIVGKSKLGSALTIDNCTFRINHIFDYKCALCIKGVKNNTIYKSKFIFDQNYDYKSLFNVSNGLHINVLNFQFNTEAVAHFHFSNGLYHILTKRSIFKKGKVSLLSRQPHFIKDAKAAGKIQKYSVDISHKEIDKSIKVESNGKGTYFPTILISIFSLVILSTVCLGLCIFCKKRKTRQVKRMREFHAFLSCSCHDLEKAQILLNKLEEKNKFKLIFAERDFALGVPTIQNIENAVESSNCAIIILSMKFLES